MKMNFAALKSFSGLYVALLSGISPYVYGGGDGGTASLVEQGRYLAQIGACSACHTPPKVASPEKSALSPEEERQFRADPDWTLYLDHSKEMAGGVPFWMRFSKDLHGVVFSRNLTSDTETGLGAWSDTEIATAIQTGKRKDGSFLFLFPPHTFYQHLSAEDVRALVAYLRTLPGVRNAIPQRDLPAMLEPRSAVVPDRTTDGGQRSRASYLLMALVGCRECHSYKSQGILQEFVGGDPVDPFGGVFRLGPDLPLRASERGYATFPFPGYATQYAGNLTRFGVGGPLAKVPESVLVRAIKHGVSPRIDQYGRPIILGHIMLWQYYSKMRDDDAYAIARLIKRLQYKEHNVPSIQYFGSDWAAAFKSVFGEAPSDADRSFFGK